MSTVDYWLIDSDEGRQEYGIPRLLTTQAYTDKNAQLINAYVITYESTGDASVTWKPQSAPSTRYCSTGTRKQAG